MKIMLIIISIVFLHPFSALGQDGTEIIKEVEDNLNGKTAFMEFSMMVTTKRASRSMDMESWSVGKSKSFIRILYPKKDRGITFLKIDNGMWQYIPKIEKIIKIPASMMLQSWMGSDFTNDDLVKESSITRDYDASLVEQTDALFIIALHPKEDAPVVWGKILMAISRDLYLPTTVTYFDEYGEEIRIIEYLEVKMFGARHYPTRWVVSPSLESKRGHQTVIKVKEAIFDEPIEAGRFSKRALKRYSR